MSSSIFVVSFNFSLLFAASIFCKGPFERTVDKILVVKAYKGEFLTCVSNFTNISTPIVRYLHLSFCYLIEFTIRVGSKFCFMKLFIEYHGEHS